MPKCNAVFQGGGIKGTGFAGAVMELEQAGYQFENMAGTSAGAIVAALLAAGYSGAEIRDELMRVDYKIFLDASWIVRKSRIAKMINMAFKWGIYRADIFENWLNGLLEKKGKRYFRDIRTGCEKHPYKFTAIASNITNKTMLLLPSGLAEYGINPDDFPISTAVRMSMCIPFYFEPYKLTANDATHVILDGGMLSNYPMWVLDDGSSNPKTPTFGLRFSGKNVDTREKTYKNNIIDFTKGIVTTLTSAWDNWHISESTGDFARTILIPTTVMSKGKPRSIGTTEFDISESDKMQLLENGKTAARRFLDGWDFEAWKREYRGGV